MQYFVWENYMPGSGWAFAEMVDGLTPADQSRLQAGMRLAPLPEVNVTELTRGKLPDVLGAAWSGFMVSDGLRAVLDETSDDLQWIPVTVARRPRDRYWIANVLTTRPCLDRAASRVTTFTGDPDAILSVQTFVLEPIPADAGALFHVAEMPHVVLIRSDLKSKLEAASSSPGRFLHPDDFSF